MKSPAGFFRARFAAINADDDIKTIAPETR